MTVAAGEHRNGNHTSALLRSAAAEANPVKKRDVIIELMSRYLQGDAIPVFATAMASQKTSPEVKVVIFEVQAGVIRNLSLTVFGLLRNEPDAVRGLLRPVEGGEYRPIAASSIDIDFNGESVEVTSRQALILNVTRIAEKALLRVDMYSILSLAYGKRVSRGVMEGFQTEAERLADRGFLSKSREKEMAHDEYSTIHYMITEKGKEFFEALRQDKRLPELVENERQRSEAGLERGSFWWLMV